MNLLTQIINLCIAILLTTACRRDNDLPEVPEPPSNEAEQITTVELHITRTSDQQHSMVAWEDNDGPGGNEPVIDTIVLSKESSFDVSVEFWDGSGETPVDVTEEVREEGTEHLVCFDAEDGLEGLSITISDSDGTHPIGLESSWQTKGPSGGSLKLRLKHQPNGKDGTCTPGETDVEVAFPVRIE